MHSHPKPGAAPVKSVELFHFVHDAADRIRYAVFEALVQCVMNVRGTVDFLNRE